MITRAALLRAATVALGLSLSVGCAPDDTSEPSPSLIEGRWTLRTASSLDASSTRSLVGATLTFESDHSWRLRYDYHLTSTPSEIVWSSGLYGTWEAQSGEPVALRVRVIDDGTTAVATIPSTGLLDITLAGNRMRLERTPE